MRFACGPKSANTHIHLYGGMSVSSMGVIVGMYRAACGMVVPTELAKQGFDFVPLRNRCPECVAKGVTNHSIGT